MPEGSTKPARTKRRARDQIGPALAAVFRHGQALHGRQMDWNALLSLEAQERSWLLDWREGTLQVLVESSVWLAWLRRNQKRICQQWNSRFPDEPVERIVAVVRPWRPPMLTSRPVNRTQIAGPAPDALRKLAENSDGALGAALQRLVRTLDQAGTVASESTKENGAFSGEE